MIYRLPTQPPPLDPPKPKAKVVEHIPYPPVTTGRGIPTKIASIKPVYIRAGQTYQLAPVLQDVTGVTQEPTDRFTFRSNNPRIPVSDTGLVITACPPNVVSRRGAGETAIITVSYGSTAPITSLVDIHVSGDFDNVISD
jgi:hypothetical protein